MIPKMLYYRLQQFLMQKNPLRKLLHKVGFDFHRYRPEVDRLEWLTRLNINTVFDIGANVGQFAKEIRALLPRSKIYSFEPVKECFEKLSSNFKNDNNFQALNIALGETTGKSTINKSSYTPSSSLLSMAESHKKLFPHSRNSEKEEIEIKRLDDIYREVKPEKELLVKVDTQGYEDKVISGGIQTFSDAKVLIIETSFVKLYENQPLFDQIHDKMRSLNFSYRGSLHQKIDQKTGEVIFEDSIFLRA